MRLIVHRAADSDVDELYDSEDPTLEDMAAAIEVLLEEISNDPEFLCRMYRPNQLLNHPGNRGGCLVKVKQVPQPVLQVVDSNALRLRPAGCPQSIPAVAG